MRRLQTIILSLFGGLYLLFFLFQSVSADSAEINPDYDLNRSFENYAYTPVITGTNEAISVCSRHAPKCPLEYSKWPYDDEGWQLTGKKWTWYANTPLYKNRKIVWEWSQPYSGDNPDYFGHREDQYTDFTNTPDEFLITNIGQPPVTYDWERWMKEGENYRMMQFGTAPEDESHLVGESDCDSGVYYPVVDHLLNYFYTPMATDLFEKCIGGGYVSSVLVEVYGEPGSITREKLCNDPIHGVPLLHSPVGNAICNMSPYVGKVYQRYVFGSQLGGAFASIGCEAVVYAWGWSPPHLPESGQDYEVWFRNGELRFSRWHSLSGEILGIPDPDDDDWWNPRCEGAWTEQANWLYSGTFRAGMGVYSDRVVKQGEEKYSLPEAGGNINLESQRVKYTFPESVFQDEVAVTIMEVFPEEIPLEKWNQVINGPFRIYAELASNDELVQPTSQYVIEAGYGDGNQSLADANRIGIYFWSGRDWIKEASGIVNLEAKTVTALPNRLGVWAVLAEPYQVFFPKVLTVQ